ncbi:MAG: hypothetical protein AAFZ17_10560 [Cyanobacteria bacterium J06650_10]
MSYRRSSSELSYPFVRSVFIVLSIVFIYTLQQMANTTAVKTKLSVSEHINHDISQSHPALDADPNLDSPDDSRPLLFSELLLALSQ